MYLCYESPLPIGCGLMAGLFLLDKAFNRRKLFVLLSALAATWMLYAGGYLWARVYVKDLLHLNFQPLKVSAFDAWLPSHVHDYAVSGFQWLLQSTIVDNSGFPLVVRAAPRTSLTAMISGAPVTFQTPAYHFYTTLKEDPSKLYVLLVTSAWLVLLFNIARKPILSRRIAFALMILFCGTVLMVVGRTLTGKKEYLAGMNIYHYVPAAVFALILGLFVVNATAKYQAKAVRTLASFLLVIILLAASTRQVVSMYMGVEGRTLALFQRVETVVAMNPSKRIYVDYKMPRAPTWHPFLADERHTFHTFHSVFGDAIVERRNLADLVIDAEGVVRANVDRPADP